MLLLLYIHDKYIQYMRQYVFTGYFPIMAYILHREITNGVLPTKLKLCEFFLFLPNAAILM